MVLYSIVGYDATGGGVLAVVNPTSLTIKGGSGEKSYIVGYVYDGISAEEVTITNTQNTSWPAAGFSLKATSDGTAVGAGLQFKPLNHKIPVNGGDVLVMTATSGANPVHCILYIDRPPYTWKLRDPWQATSEANYWTRVTVAGGTNCAAGTSVQGATNLTNFGDRVWTPVQVEAAAAFTTTAFLGIRKLGGSDITYWLVGLTDVANDIDTQAGLPMGMDTFTKGDAMEVHWISATAEQPTANITFATTPVK